MECSIFFAGDFCSKPSTSKITVSDELKNKIQSCDLKVVNFEVPLKPDLSLPKQSRKRFFQNDDAPDFLRRIGFNLFSQANNHAFDWGVEGFKKTKKALGEQSFGAGTYDEAYKIKVVEVNGIKIGFMALSFAAYTGVFDDVTKKEGLGCAYINDLNVNHLIINAKWGVVDYLFVLPHDGIEYIDVPLPETIARYRDFIDGADGVIGTHPHCPQGWEEYKGKPIFYSLGNFLFNSMEGYDFHDYTKRWYWGMCVMISIKNRILSWEVVNTKNVNNTGIVVDHNEERDEHNKSICNYLTNNDSYYKYLETAMKKQIINEKLIFYRTFQPQSIRAIMSSLRTRVIKMLTKKATYSDNEIMYLLKNDIRRARIIKVFKENNSQL